MRFSHIVTVISAVTKSGEPFEGLIRMKFIPRNPGYVVSIRVNGDVRVVRRRGNDIDVEKEVYQFMKKKFSNWRFRWATYQDIQMNDKMASVPTIPPNSMK